MAVLSRQVAVFPVVGKADSLTEPEASEVRAQLQRELSQGRLGAVAFPPEVLREVLGSNTNMVPPWLVVTSSLAEDNVHKAWPIR